MVFCFVLGLATGLVASKIIIGSTLAQLKESCK
jgi:hypothetical protein